MNCLEIQVRLCRNRCGPSTAVLELILDHGVECHDEEGCRCRPPPDDAEARLLAHFSRHSLLRLAAKEAPVRVQLECLPEAEELEQEDVEGEEVRDFDD